MFPLLIMVLWGTYSKPKSFLVIYPLQLVSPQFQSSSKTNLNLLKWLILDILILILLMKRGFLWFVFQTTSDTEPSSCSLFPINALNPPFENWFQWACGFSYYIMSSWVFCTELFILEEVWLDELYVTSLSLGFF